MRGNANTFVYPRFGPVRTTYSIFNSKLGDFFNNIEGKPIREMGRFGSLEMSPGESKENFLSLMKKLKESGEGTVVAMVKREHAVIYKRALGESCRGMNDVILGRNLQEYYPNNVNQVSAAAEWFRNNYGIKTGRTVMKEGKEVFIEDPNGEMFGTFVKDGKEYILQAEVFKVDVDKAIPILEKRLSRSDPVAVAVPNQ